MSVHGRVAATLLKAMTAGAALFGATATAADSRAVDSRAAFAEHCAACHGEGGEGLPGIAPDLTDDRWIWGGAQAEVETVIAHGVRNGDPLALDARMPAFGADGLLYDDEIAAIVAAIVQASGREADAGAAATGAELYLDHCATCHGEDMQGGYMGGAPALSGPSWLFGGAPEALAAQIHDPAHGVMPGWLDVLGPDGVAAMAEHVLSLSR